MSGQKRKRNYQAEYQARMAKAQAETGKTYNQTRGRGKLRSTPTGDTYLAFQQAFEHFNRELFGGELPDCMITLRTFGKARGYFKSDSFADLGTATTVHEIAMDPRQFISRSTVEILSTLVHEMCHLWQQEHGTPSRNGYHNGEWAKLMMAIGLVPTDTGEPGGKMTGQKVTHYIMEDGGEFAAAAKKLVESGKFKAAWVDVEGFQLDAAGKGSAKLVPAPKAAGGKSGKRSKYVCPACTSAVWGKAGLMVACGGTQEAMHEAMVMLD